MIVYDVPTTTRFRGLTRRQGVLWQGSAGWAEWSPFPEYPPGEAATWLRAAREMADEGFPAPRRDRVPVNVTVPALDPAAAYERVRASGCTTAKVKVAEPGGRTADDVERVAAVRDALGARGRLRIDANGAWDVATALAALRSLAPYDLEYAEQPCATTEQLAELRVALARAGLDVPIAADESIRRTGDPERVVALAAADIAVLKVQPLGGVRACLAADVTRSPLVAVDGWLEVRDVAVDPPLLEAAAAGPATAEWWRSRLAEASAVDAPAS